MKRGVMQYDYYVPEMGACCPGIIQNYLKNSMYGNDIVEIECNVITKMVTISTKKIIPNKLRDTIEEAGFSAERRKKIGDQETYHYYFEIEGVKSEEWMDGTIKQQMQQEGFVDNVSVEPALGRARVTLFKPDPQAVLEAMKKIPVNAKWLTKSCTLYFSIKGLTPENKPKIEELLESKTTEIDAFRVNYAAKTIAITTYMADPVDNNKKTTFENKLIEDVCKISEVQIQSIEPPIGVTDTHIDPQKYLNRAYINFILVALLYIFSGWIPLPVTLFGQGIGLFLGTITLGSMWYTGKEFYTRAWTQMKNVLLEITDLLRIAVRQRYQRWFANKILEVQNDNKKDPLIDENAEYQENIKDASAQKTPSDAKRIRFTMDTLIALGTSPAWIFSMLLVLMPSMFPVAFLQYEFSAVILILGIINYGKGIQARALEKTGKNIQSLANVYAELQPKIARKVLDVKEENIAHVEKNHTLEIDYLNIKKGDILKVNVGEAFPVEGVIVFAKEDTMVNEAIFNGESRPCQKKVKDTVLSGSVNEKYPVYIKATCDGKDGGLITHIAVLAKSSAKAQSNESSEISELLNKIAAYFVPSIIGLALLSGIGWWILGPVPQIVWALNVGRAVLLCACPCALFLAAPISMVICILELFNRCRIHVRNVRALEKAAKSNVVVFDKTGTLTTLTIENIFADAPNLHEDEIMGYATSLEDASLKKGDVHPLAKMFVEKYCDRTLWPAKEIKKSDQGISGVVNGRKVMVGSALHLGDIQIDQQFQAKEKANDTKGMTSLYIVIDGKCVAIVGCKHTLRKGAKEEVQALRNLGQKIIILTGDKEEPTKKVAKELGILIYKSGLSKEGKADYINSLKDKGNIVIMLGDGMNDTLGILAADVGVAFDPGTTASARADMAVERLNVSEMISIARETMSNIHQNLWCTGFYNVLSIITAMGLLYPFFGFMLNPAVASLSMAFSSTFVVFNSSRLTFIIDDVMDRIRSKVYGPKTWKSTFVDIFSFKALKTFRQTLDMFIPLSHWWNDTLEMTPRTRSNRPSASIEAGSEHFPIMVQQQHKTNKVHIKQEEILVEDRTDRTVPILFNDPFAEHFSGSPSASPSNSPQGSPQKSKKSATINRSNSGGTGLGYKYI